MCTLVALHGVHPAHPLVLAANRDEFYARAADPPRLLAEAPRIVGGVDRESGGTWLGANEHGLFVGLTNQRTHEAPSRTRASRGPFVREALAQRDPDAVEALLRALPRGATNPFNLLFGVPGDLRVAYVRDEGVESATLAPGVVVLGNDRLGSPEFEVKTARARDIARATLAREGPALIDALREMLRDHRRTEVHVIAPPPPTSIFSVELLEALSSLCIHTPAYGTVSAAILLWGTSGRVERFLHAEGSPCRAEFADVVRP